MSNSASYMRSPTWTIDAIIRAHEAKGGHFFDRGTMKGFNSRVLGDVAEGPGGVYFVTSETCGRGAPLREDFFPLLVIQGHHPDRMPSAMGRSN